MHFYAGEINAYAGEIKDQKGGFIVGRKMVLSYVYLGEIIPSFRLCVTMNMPTGGLVKKT